MTAPSGDALLDLCRAHASCTLCAAETPAVHTCELCRGVGVKPEVLAAFRAAFSPPTVYQSEGGFTPEGSYCATCWVKVGDAGHTWQECATRLKDQSDAVTEEWMKTEASYGDLLASTLRYRLKEVWWKLRTFLR